MVLSKCVLLCFIFAHRDEWAVFKCGLEPICVHTAERMCHMWPRPPPTVVRVIRSQMYHWYVLVCVHPSCQSCPRASRSLRMDADTCSKRGVWHRIVFYKLREMKTICYTHTRAQSLRQQYICSLIISSGCFHMFGFQTGTPLCSRY